MPEQSGFHFADNIFNCILLNKKDYTSVQISLKFVPNGPIDSISRLGHVMAWCQTGNKPLTEPMLTEITEALLPQ